MVATGVRLLLDQNLSARLLPEIERSYPGSTHVRSVGLERADDGAVWDYAAREAFVIVSKDMDFYQRSILFGHPPKVIWLAAGELHTKAIGSILAAEADTIARFLSDAEKSFLVLS